MFGSIYLKEGDAILHVDPQKDFMDGGALAVKGGRRVIGPVNSLTEIALKSNVPVAMSGDWHPEETTHFQEFGGPWPVHCVAETKGAEFGDGIQTNGVEIFHKGMSNDSPGYSPWEGISTATGKSLEAYLRDNKITRVFVDGLATDYCVKQAVLGARDRHFDVYVIKEGTKAVNVKRNDGRKAVSEMKKSGAKFISLRRIAR